MNETIENIIKRRSIRSFKKDPVPMEYLEKIVECGTYAANGMSMQPWHFTVISKREVLDKIAEENRRALLNPKNGAGRQGVGDPDFDLFWGAPAAVIISGETEGVYVAAACANATQNMAVAATSLGLGSCYLTSIKLPLSTEQGVRLKKDLGIPSGYVPLFALTLGYTNEAPEEREPRKPDAVNFV